MPDPAAREDIITVRWVCCLGKLGKQRPGGQCSLTWQGALARASAVDYRLAVHLKHACCALSCACRLSSVKHCLTAAQIHQLAQHTQGFVGADLAALVNEAALAALRRHVGALQHQQHQQQQQKQEHDGKGGAGLCVCWSDFEAARLLVRPSALREVAVEVPQVRHETGFSSMLCAVEGHGAHEMAQRRAKSTGAGK